jgi:hypothetical protein
LAQRTTKNAEGGTLALTIVQKRQIITSWNPRAALKRVGIADGCCGAASPPVDKLFLCSGFALRVVGVAFMTGNLGCSGGQQKTTVRTASQADPNGHAWGR